MKFLIYLFAFVASAMSQSASDILRASNDNFTANFFQEVIKEKPNRSVVMSAFSMLVPLALMAIASRGPTRDEILQAIPFLNGTDDDVLNVQFVNAINELQSPRYIRLASTLFSSDNFLVLEKFKAEAKKIYVSKVQTVDFSDNQDAGKINEWVENNTNHEIKNLVSTRALGASTAAVLVNSVYFKSNWSKAFNPRSTVNGYFRVSRNENVTLRLMHQRNIFKYGVSEELDAKLLEMPYEGNKASFLAILPNKYDGIGALVEKLKEPSIVSRAMENMRSHEVRAVIPRIKIETSTNVKETLKELSIVDVFSDSADLEGITGEQNLRLTKALQKATVVVSEGGSVAAAANGLLVSKIATCVEGGRTSISGINKICQMVIRTPLRAPISDITYIYGVFF